VCGIIEFERESMSDDESSRFCSGCRIRAPEVESAHALLGEGWRPRRVDEDGAVTVEWWCPPCWAELKKTTGGVFTPHMPFAPLGKKPE
jgi:hypothetical protein